MTGHRSPRSRRARSHCTKSILFRRSKTKSAFATSNIHSVGTLELCIGVDGLEEIIAGLRRPIQHDPSDSDGRIGDKAVAQGRPSLIAFLISLSEIGLERLGFPISCWRARRSRTAALTWARRRWPSGTIRATGLSCRVITISSPRETRSRSSPKRVFASNAVMVATINNI